MLQDGADHEIFKKMDEIIISILALEGEYACPSLISLASGDATVFESMEDDQWSCGYHISIVSHQFREEFIQLGEQHLYQGTDCCIRISVGGCFLLLSLPL